MKSTLARFLLALLLLGTGLSLSVHAQDRRVTLTLDFAKNLGPIEMNHVSLGQGGLSPDPMWNDRVPEVRALHPHLIRLFIQEYFNIMPAPDRYDFQTLDQSVDEILRTGAVPLMCIAVRPKLLFPVNDQDVVDPTDYDQWEHLIYALVDHYLQRGLRGLYWEVGNEGDIGELGGSPFRFTPENYVPFYRHTATAVLGADPTARVGGPALASYKSPILPALLSSAEREQLPIAFVSWHTYSSDPHEIESTIESVKKLLEAHPSLHAETILDEWNMALTVPPKDPRIQPAFVAETVWRMKESGLTYSCYYHIRDYHVEREVFEPFFDPGSASFMAAWWNRMPQYSGLFDYQNVARPAYFAFKLLARVTGDRLEATSDDRNVHAFLAYDKSYAVYSLLLWNFSPKAVSIMLRLKSSPGKLLAHRRMLDAVASSSDENVRLRPLSDLTFSSDAKIDIQLGPYGMEFLSIEPHGWPAQLVEQRH